MYTGTHSTQEQSTQEHIVVPQEHIVMPYMVLPHKFQCENVLLIATTHSILHSQQNNSKNNFWWMHRLIYINVVIVSSVSVASFELFCNLFNDCDSQQLLTWWLKPLSHCVWDHKHKAHFDVPVTTVPRCSISNNFLPGGIHAQFFQIVQDSTFKNVVIYTHTVYYTSKTWKCIVRFVLWDLLIFVNWF